MLAGDEEHVAVVGQEHGPFTEVRQALEHAGGHVVQQDAGHRTLHLADDTGSVAATRH